MSLRDLWQAGEAGITGRDKRKGKETLPFPSVPRAQSDLQVRLRCNPIAGFLAMPDGWVLGNSFKVINWTLLFPCLGHSSLSPSHCSFPSLVEKQRAGGTDW